MQNQEYIYIQVLDIAILFFVSNYLTKIYDFL